MRGFYILALLFAGRGFWECTKSLVFFTEGRDLSREQASWLVLAGVAVLIAVIEKVRGNKGGDDAEHQRQAARGPEVSSRYGRRPQ